MSFPYHDLYWTETPDFLNGKIKSNESVLATDLFWWLFPDIYRYTHTFAMPKTTYDWVIIHKGEANLLQTDTLRYLFKKLNPVYANDVFVVLSKSAHFPKLDKNNNHIKSLSIIIDALSKSPVKTPPNDVSFVENTHRITKFNSMNSHEFLNAMNSFFKNGGYRYETVRDKTYYREIDRHIENMIASDIPTQRTILDLCCGIGRLKSILQNEKVIGIDISDTAIDIAKSTHKEYPDYEFHQMDAHHLAFPDNYFDVVLFIDAIEHVHNAEIVMKEVARVLKPGGVLMTTIANRDSLNQFMTRKLGYPEFVTNYQHIKEFSFEESKALLNHAGLDIINSSGIFLFPYWGIPGIDHLVRHLTDNDAETVELMRILGERVGAEHAYASVLLGMKKPQ